VPEAERRRFACPSVAGEFDEIDLSSLDPNDEDDRRILIQAEHPDLQDALEDGRDVHVGGEVMNPRLHISMHEIVTNQLWADEPAEVWQAAQRLTKAGYDRHEVFHMLGSVMSSEVWATLHHGEPFDLERFRRGLEALPQSWEAMRDDWPAERTRNRAERRAAERRRHRSR
jgi:hypothetical protein